jgi:hypothetical protein
MKRAPRSRQRHDLYAKYHDYDSEISDLLGECGVSEPWHWTCSACCPIPNDEHVLAAAIAARCDTLVTDNLKDFPQGILDRWGIEVMSPDDFISNAMDLDHAVAIGALRDMRARLKDPKYTVSALVLKLEGQGLLQTADFLREYENLI